MNRLRTLFIPACLLLAHATFAKTLHAVLPTDSVGVERKDGKRFILHRVDQGQTLYAVARRYGSSVDAIKAANPDLNENSIRYDQLLRVPVADVSLSRKEQRDAEKAIKKEEKEKQKVAQEAAKVIAEETAPVTKNEPKPKVKSDKLPDKTAQKTGISTTGIHVVETGQTLYSLAVRYGVTMADIRKWNELGADGIQVGQSLIVSEKAFDAKKAADGTATATVVKPRPTPVKIDELEPAKPEAKPKPAPTKSTETELTKPKSTPVKSAESEPTRLESKPIVTPDPLPTPGSKPKPKPVEKVAEPKTTEPSSDNEPVANNRKANVKSEIGFADLIEGNDVSSKYLALHRSAPTGTLVQVRNDITNQSLYVKVIGKLPDTGINNQVLIRLSGRAFEKLSPNGQRFRAEVSYSN